MTKVNLRFLLAISFLLFASLLLFGCTSEPQTQTGNQPDYGTGGHGAAYQGGTMDFGAMMRLNKTPYAVENATAFFKEIISRGGMGNKTMLKYAILFSANGASTTMGGTYTSRSMAGMERIDTVTQVGAGPGIETRLYVLGNSTYTCMRLPDFQCYEMDLGVQGSGSGSGTDVVADYGAGLDKSLDENEITQVYSTQIAGTGAYCFEFRSRLDGRQSENCFTEAGVPAKFTYETEQGSMSMMLMNASTDVDAGDFELPAEPQPLILPNETG